MQGALFIAFCILMKKVRLIYFSSFATGLIYGAILDFWRFAIPAFNPSVTAPGSLPFVVRIIYFTVGMLLTSLSIAMFFKTYLYPQVYDFFVKGVSEYYGINRTKFKMCYDISSLAAACLLTLLLFHRFVGIGVGTVVMTCFNGILIGIFGKILDRFFVFVPTFENFAKKFEPERLRSS